MPDGLRRLHHSGQAHFLTFSCFHRLPLLAQMNMQNAFLLALEQTRRRFQMQVYGYVVMPEHVHLLLSEPAGEMLARAVQMLKSRVSIQARKESQRTRGEAPFWQTRYFDHNVRNHAGFVTQLRYIHRNPVKRNLCLAPEEWPWSSFRAWALGEIGLVEVESEMFAARREASKREIPTAHIRNNSQTAVQR
ncbi:MAG: transposase [Terracidiphilus sp.]|nr:transposase [Terracidiphilus sp.]MDR3776044.1 transposase [Terracidiphilus sp.]